MAQQVDPAQVPIFEEILADLDREAGPRADPYEMASMMLLPPGEELQHGHDL